MTTELPDTETPAQPAPPSTSLLQRLRPLWPYFGKSPATWAVVALCTIVGASTEPMIPAVIDLLLERGFVKRELDLWTVPAMFVSIFAVRGLAGYVAQLGLSSITNNGLTALRSAMFKKVLQAQLQLFSAESSSSLSNAIVYETQTGAAMLVNSLLSLTRNALTLVAMMAYLLFLNWQLTLIVIAVFPAVAWVMRKLTSRLHKLTKANQQATDSLAYVVEENVLAHKDIRLYSAQTSQAVRFDKLGESLRHLAMKSTVAGAAMTPMTQMLAAMALSAVIAVALAQSTSSGTTVGGFMAFVVAMLMIIAPIRQLSEVSSPIIRGLVALERGLALIHATPNETEGTFAKSRATGDIVFTQVGVQYASGSAPVISQLDLSVASGETIAIVGASGAGKSTLVNLLPRFVDASTGSISLDGHALADWNLQSLRSQFAFVSQHVIMLNDSIAANVALGMDLNRSKVTECLRAGNLGGLIGDLPQGIDTVVGHNAMQLSGGQRQRLAIARALYKDAPILILDEATSALDTESERAVQEALQGLMRNRTTLVIAHRLSTVMHADRIVTMDAGRIVEIGNHQELLDKNGHYARLYQMGLESFVAKDAPVLTA
ncbi:lipid A export permease/ATP-binding protein MsbA [Rhodoferax sp. AJA081-3]|uniref:lipid A export permease/ATP-binding protein MsbA n=1 Tax=Rhodoferax sp. AJA081-3 TaxID=2752316 RepID=UPI001ADF2FEF|nr:lipid A export permease/ATP-binding protein MsbA [Rhodoferax sp. AJA081-3]QTN28953.1 lipid A export permease/ATP-binding protein MsbA [Rhodoferax sp. AJA081-3]